MIYRYRIECSTAPADSSATVTEVIPHLGTGSPKSGYVFKTFRLTAANGLPNRGFLRGSVR